VVEIVVAPTSSFSSNFPTFCLEYPDSVYCVKCLKVCSFLKFMRGDHLQSAVSCINSCLEPINKFCVESWMVSRENLWHIGTYHRYQIAYFVKIEFVRMCDNLHQLVRPSNLCRVFCCHHHRFMADVGMLKEKWAQNDCLHGHHFIASYRAKRFVLLAVGHAPKHQTASRQ
jgi:hypothetical protein